jgi:hypothetical protein
VLTPTLLPNLLLATRTALFPANTRPTSQTAVGHTGAPASALQSVQTPTSSESTLPPAASPGSPIVERVKGPGTSDGFGKTSNPGNKGNNGNNDRGSPSTAAIPGAPGSRSSITDPAAAPSTDEQAEAEKGNRPTKAEIAAIKRRCAASLLALIPRSVARAFLGVPPSAPPVPYIGDGTCSSNSSNSLATSPPTPIIGPDHGSSLHSSEDNLASSHSHSPSSIPHPVASGHLAAERLRTDDDPSAGMDPEEVHFLQIIEKDLLDLFADEYCNKHLVYAIVEAVLARLLPEMAERCVEDLLEDRGVASVHVPLAF